MTPKTKPCARLFRTDYPGTGRVRSEGLLERGKQDGTWTYYYPDGSLERRARFAAGVLHGHEQRFYRSGALRAEAWWDEGRRVGTWRWYAEDGAVREEVAYSRAA